MNKTSHSAALCMVILSASLALFLLPTEAVSRSVNSEAMKPLLFLAILAVLAILALEAIEAAEDQPQADQPQAQKKGLCKIPRILKSLISVM